MQMMSETVKHGGKTFQFVIPGAPVQIITSDVACAKHLMLDNFDNYDRVCASLATTPCVGGCIACRICTACHEHHSLYLPVIRHPYPIAHCPAEPALH
jgi:hypothetical protein